MIDSLIDAPFDAYPSQLQQNGSSRSMNQISADRKLHDGTVALRYRDESRRVFSAEFV
jgi:hypothetical protein